jgi:hypothetical protein
MRKCEGFDVALTLTDWRQNATVCFHRPGRQPASAPDARQGRSAMSEPEQQPEVSAMPPRPDADRMLNVAEPGASIYAVLHGDMHIRNGYPVYKVSFFPLQPRPVPPSRARQQPSRLLAADSQVVAFAGREDERATLAHWRDDAEPGVSVMLVHAPGGQGKTRLAARFAADSAAAGWTVWAAHHLSDPTAEHVTSPGESGPRLVLIIDYADRWPLDDLFLLLENPLLRRSGRGRVLLVGRAPGAWWPSLRHRLGKAGISVGSSVPLAPLADSDADREAAFTSARDAFAAILGTSGPAILPPAALTGKDFGPVLNIHMAALVAVDARRRGRSPPTDPASLSGYLLDREHDFWHAAHDHDIVGTAPQVMSRVVYVASLTGATSRETGLAVLGRARVAGPAAAPAVLDDHAQCYPPPAAEPGTVLQPLNPDRLAEDFVALTTPGHAHLDYQADRWAAGAVARLLAQELPGPAPPYTRGALITLVETARRWPHVAHRQLYPLLRAHPQLAITRAATLWRQSPSGPTPASSCFRPSRAGCLPGGTPTWTSGSRR